MQSLRDAHIDQGSLQLLDFRGASDVLRRWLGKASITRMLLNKCIAEPECIPHPSRDSLLTIGTFPKARKQHRKRLASRLQHAECRGALILASKEHSLDGLTRTGLFDGSSEARKGEHRCIPILSPKLGFPLSLGRCVTTVQVCAWLAAAFAPLPLPTLGGLGAGGVTVVLWAPRPLGLF